MSYDHLPAGSSPASSSAEGGGRPHLLAERVLRTMPGGVLALNREGILQLLNPYAARLLGRPADADATAVLGQPLAQVLPADFPAELRAALQEACIASGPVRGEFFLTTSQQWLAMTTDPSPTEVLVYWQDVTRAKSKHQQYQALADNTPDVLMRWDRGLRLCYANPALEAKIGQPPAAVVGKTFREMGAPAAIATPYMAKLQQVLDTCQPLTHDNSFPTPQGERYYHSRIVPELHDGQVQTVLAIARDITELRQAAHEAAAQLHFNAQVAAASPDRIQVRELATSRVLYVNRAVLPELGYDPDQIIAAHARGEVPFPGEPSDKAALAVYWSTFATAADEAIPLLEHRLRALNGTWHWYRMRGKVFARDAQGQPTQALSVATDITAERHAQAELLRLQLAQQQQLANAVLTAQEVERRRIAEDLHNGVGQLLYAVKLHLDVLGGLQENAAVADSKLHLQQLLTTAITQVRTLSHQLIPTVLEDFGLAAAVRDLCLNFRTPQFHLHCSVEELPPLPPALALAIYRMAQELIQNIIRHAEAIEAHLHLRERAGWLELRAHDNGHGFDPALPRPPGLGLNALHDRVQLLSGQVTITSSAAQGTQIIVRVPLAALPA